MSAPAPPAVCPACGAAGVARTYRLRLFEVWTCAACTLRFRHPLPRPEDLIGMYEDARYHASAYFQEAGPSSPEMRIYRRGLADLAVLRAAAAGPAEAVPRPRLLDLGCGPGVFLALARDAGWEVAGVELSAGHVAEARARHGLEVWQGDVLRAPFAPGSFDAVTMWDVLEHVLDPHAVLARAHALLAPGGLLLVFTIDVTSLFNLAGDWLHRLTGGRAARALELLYDARHNWYFTQAALARLLAAEHFHVERWRADRAYLGRWVSEPAPWYLMAGGFVVDLVSSVVRRSYRRTAICRRSA